MKYVLAIVGVIASWATYHWFPTAFGELFKVTGFPAGVAALATALTAGWAICLGKLASFEKLDDLRQGGRDRVTKFAAKVRSRIVVTISINCVSLAICLMLIFSSQVVSFSQLRIESWSGYILGAVFGYWLGGSLDTWRCYSVIEQTKDELLEAQRELKARAGYLARLRSDAATHPLGGDSHLEGYSSQAG